MNRPKKPYLFLWVTFAPVVSRSGPVTGATAAETAVDLGFDPRPPGARETGNFSVITGVSYYLEQKLQETRAIDYDKRISTVTVLENKAD